MHDFVVTWEAMGRLCPMIVHILSFYNNRRVVSNLHAIGVHSF